MTAIAKAWTSVAWFDADYFRHLTFDPPADFVRVIRQMKRGEPVRQDELPWRMFPRRARLKTLPDIFCIRDGLMIVSERLATLMKEFEFGQNQLFEIELYNLDRETRISDRYFILNVTERKENSFVPEKTKGPINEVHGTYRPAPSGYEGVAVRRSSIDGGADLWMDPILYRTPFFSGALGEAIQNGEFGRTGLKQCIVVP